MGGGAREIDSIEIPLVHVKQHLSWDCGISAVMMILRLYMKENLEDVSRQEGFDKSTWTIDLAYLLRKFGIRHLYVTVTIGVNPGYSEEDFYQRVLKKDAQRISDRFSTADLNNVKVEKKCLMQVLGCCNSSFAYQGHYVVLCGFNKTERKILYRNPSVINKVCTIPYDSFEIARKSFGTDEDVLFVFLNS
ncbi:protein GUCD1 [Caerostris extrusa]|uniref:Protein GUCD1 n=1 Tax=Caerostris extrusa TaxID=172846 RepID=A0AAV4SWP4_CAEEX|nr:protein GUCD1 [Caerostris extrusa]